MYRFDGSTVLVIKTDVMYTSDTSERHTFSHPPGRKTLSMRATRRRPHSKPLVGQACSFDVGERMAHALDGGEAKNTVAARWRERRRSRPQHPSRRRPNLLKQPSQPHSDNPTPPTQPNTKQPHSKHDSQVGPSGCAHGAEAYRLSKAAVRGGAAAWQFLRCACQASADLAST